MIMAYLKSIFSNIALRYSLAFFLYQRAKPPQGTALLINLLGTGLTRRACMGDGGSLWWAPGQCSDTKDERAITVCQTLRPDQSVHKCKAVFPNCEPFHYLFTYLFIREKIISFCQTRRFKIVSRALDTRVLIMPRASIMSEGCAVVLKTGCVRDWKICMSQRKIMKTVIAPEEKTCISSWKHR